MQSSQTIELLNDLLHGMVNSVVQYAEISQPYVPDGFDEQMETIRGIADDEKRLATELVALIQARDGVPQVRVFRYWNVDLNYLDIRFMAKFAVEQETVQIHRFEEELEALAQDPEAHALAKKVLEARKGHFEKLSEIAASYET